MKVANTILASAAVAATICMSAAVAQQTGAGVIIGINRLNGTVAIQPTHNGTVGMNADAATEQFKVKDGAMLEAVHVEDKVTYSVAENGGVKTITKLEKQK